MTDTYDNVYDPAIVEPSRVVEYNYSTGVGSGENEIAPRRVEMTVNPSYETGICSKECVAIAKNQIYKTPMNLLAQSQQLLIWWMNMTVNCLNSMKRGHVTILHSQQILK